MPGIDGCTWCRLTVLEWKVSLESHCGAVWYRKATSPKDSTRLSGSLQHHRLTPQRTTRIRLSIELSRPCRKHWPVSKIVSVAMLEAHGAVLPPIVFVCYTHHGGVALKAVKGLMHLSSKTDFFARDGRVHMVQIDRVGVEGISQESLWSSLVSPCFNFSHEDSGLRSS